MCLAIPGKLIELFPGMPFLATVEVAGVRRKIDLGLLENDMPQAGDWVLIHVGFAMSKISEQDAMEQMQTLDDAGRKRSRPCRRFAATASKMDERPKPS